VKKISDYIFSTYSGRRMLGVEENQEYLVLVDLGDLKKGELVKFIGFDDVDNHYGICVFTDANGKVLEVTGDYCGDSRWKEVRAALSKTS